MNRLLKSVNLMENTLVHCNNCAFIVLDAFSITTNCSILLLLFHCAHIVKLLKIANYYNFLRILCTVF